ncbi:hypothetical protein MRX96_025701 [Rhipicephalus microplus]
MPSDETRIVAQFSPAPEGDDAEITFIAIVPPQTLYEPTHGASNADPTVSALGRTVELEIASLKPELCRQKAAQAISSRVEGANVADNAVHKSTQEPKFEVSKAKRKAPPPNDESVWEMPGLESSQNKMLEELLRISKEN